MESEKKKKKSKDVDIEQPKIDINVGLPSLDNVLSANVHIHINASKANVSGVDINF